MLINDGVILWFDGPEWDHIAAEAFEDAADQVRETAQWNAPWEDRTGEAREGLQTKVEANNGEVILTLFHTVEYGLWLEVIQNGRFGVIMPTLEQQAPIAFKAAEARIANARRGAHF